MRLTHDNEGDKSIIDTHLRVKCPHCFTVSGLSTISPPKYSLLQRYQPENIGIAYQCNACQETVFLRFRVKYDFGNKRVEIDPNFEEIERPQESYEYDYLPEPVAADFREALSCFSNSCFNAFAAMCRRTIQSACTELGAEGKDKVQRQIDDLRSITDIDDETFDIVRSIVLAGHDGAHPHLPSLSEERGEVLLELMKDVMHQLFVRKAKLEEAAAHRREAIEAKKRDG